MHSKVVGGRFFAVAETFLGLKELEGYETAVTVRDADWGPAKTTLAFLD